MAMRKDLQRKKTGSKAGKKISQNKMAMIAISAVVLMLLAVLLVEGQSLRQKIQTNELKKADLKNQTQLEEARTQEIEDLEEYMQSDEYIEKIAKEKIGLVKDNEIIFKEVD